MRNLMKGLLGDCLKDNDFLHTAILTGILRVAKEVIFSELNNPGTYGILDQPYASCFGFTEHEVNQLLTHANTDTKKGLNELLSPSTNYSTTQLVKEYVPLRFLENDSTYLWGLLLASGYVTAVTHQKKPDQMEHIVQLRIPNQEVTCVYNDLLRRWLTSGKGSSGTALLDALVAGQVEEFASYFKQFALESIGYFDKSNTQPERFYHGFVLGMITICKSATLSIHNAKAAWAVTIWRLSPETRHCLAL